jgi:hypothetical protein
MEANMQNTTLKPEKKSLNQPEETRSFEKGKVELVRISDIPVGRATFQPGWKWSTCVKPLAKTDSCQAPHFGYQISGTLVTLMDDGTKLVSKAGDVMNLPSGHDAWVEGNEAVVVVDFQGMADYAKKK